MGKTLETFKRNWVQIVAVHVLILLWLKGPPWLNAALSKLFLAILTIAALMPLSLIAMEFFYRARGARQRRRFGEERRADQPRFRAWFREQVGLLRELGFFEEMAKSSSDEVEQRLLRELAERFGEDLSEVRGEPSLIGALDERRVWNHALESDRHLDGAGYVEIIGEFAAISRGAFQPESVACRIDEANATVELSFEHNRTRHDLPLKYDGDWLDVSLVAKLNVVIADTGIQFDSVYRDGGESMMFAALKQEERHRLEKAGWRF